MAVPERRKFYRERVEVPATLYLRSSDRMQRPCRVVNLGGGGCEIELAAEPVDSDTLHELRFSLPNRIGVLVFQCELVAAEDQAAGDKLRLHMRFANARPGYQDSVINYVHNRKHIEKSAYRVAMPVVVDPLRGTAKAESCLGMTVEAGRGYAVADFGKTTPPVGTEVRATFLGPRIINETSVAATVDDVTRTLRGFRVQLGFDAPTDQVLEFVRKHYSSRPRPSPLTR